MSNTEMLGKKLALLRVSKNISIRQLAEMSNCSKTTIVNIEQGNFAPRVDVLQQILDALDYKITFKPKSF
mgnify:CR=1 FL=1